MPAEFKSLSLMNLLSEIKGYSWGIITYKPHAHFGPRWQRNYQLVFVHSGAARIFADRLEARVGPQEWALLLPGRSERFRFSGEGPTRHSWIHAEPARSAAASGRGHESRQTRGGESIPVGAMTARMQFIIGELLQSGNPAAGPARACCESLAAAAFFDAFSQTDLGTDDGKARRHPSVERALSLINESFADPLDLPTLARHAGSSPQHLARLFKAQIGRTPVRHLWRIREDAGARLLRESGLTIAEIAEACGFQNPFHFTRRIRERFGAPPKILRNCHWRGNSQAH